MVCMQLAVACMCVCVYVCVRAGSQVYEVPYPLPYPLYEPAPVGHEAGAGRGAVCQPVRVVGFNVRNNQLPA